jgi:hypothetical protein
MFFYTCGNKGRTSLHTLHNKMNKLAKPLSQSTGIKRNPNLLPYAELHTMYGVTKCEVQVVWHELNVEAECPTRHNIVLQ